VDNHCDGPHLYLRLLKEDPERASEVMRLLKFNGCNNSGVGVAYAKDLGGRARASFGFAEPLRFERELHVYVRVDAGTPMAVFGDVVWGADAD